jgi:hypothetical protein
VKKSATKAPKTASASAPSPDAQALARERENVARLRSATSALIGMLVQQGVITREQAGALMQQAELGELPPTAVARADRFQSTQAAAVPSGGVAPDGTAGAATGAAAAAPKPNTVRVPYVPEVVKNQIRDEVRQEVLAQAKAERWGEPGALPEWLDRISFDGDLRFRFQQNLFSDGNTPAIVYNAITGSDLGNTTQDQSRYLGRVRLGVNARIADRLVARLSITSGNALNPVSLNQNLANYMSGFSVQLTDAYLRYTPADWAVGWLGQFPKPFVSTEMLFWDDLVFDGLATTLRGQLGTSTAFATLGGFLIQNSGSTTTTPDPKTKALFGSQIGGNISLARESRLNLAVAYYDFNNIQGIPNPTLGSQVNNWTAPQFRQKGNSVFNLNYISDPTTILYGLAPEYKVLDLNASLDLAFSEQYAMRIGADYVKNLGFNQAEILGRTGLDLKPETTGYQLSLQAGKREVKSLHDWQAFFIYRHLGRDAVVDAFNDPDFYLGGTNYKGYALGLRYGLAKSSWLRARWMSADEISGPPLAIDVFQLDLNVKF